MQIETLEQAKIRNSFGNSIFEFRKTLVNRTTKRPTLGLKDKFKKFFDKIGNGLDEEKPGYDFYTKTVLVQLLILLFLLFFFSQMDGELSNVETIFVANTFPGTLVISLIFHSAVMFAERYLYLEVTSQGAGPFKFQRSLKPKFWFHILLVLTIHILVFWYFPMNSNYLKSGTYTCSTSDMYNTFKCNNFQINVALEFFYLFYMVYFVISANQIKNGAPKSRAGEFVLMKRYNTLNNILFLVYRGLPFLYEIRTLID